MSGENNDQAAANADPEQPQASVGETPPPSPEPSSPLADAAPSGEEDDAALSRRRVRRTAKTELVEGAAPVAPPAEAEAEPSAEPRGPRADDAERRPRRPRPRRPDAGEGEGRTGPAEREPRGADAARSERDRGPTPEHAPRPHQASRPGTPSRPGQPPRAPGRPGPRPAGPARGSRPGASGGSPRPAGSPRGSAGPDNRGRPEPRPQAAGPRPGTQPAAAAPRGTPQAGRQPAGAPKTPQGPVAGAKSEDKVTLILHPQPKAAPGRFKPRAQRPMTAKEALQAKAAKRGAAGQPRLGGGAPPDLPAATGASVSLPGPVALRDEWLRAGSAEAASCLVEADRSAHELIAAWQQHANVAALTAVAWGREGGAASAEGAPMRKAARRALNVLRARGVALPEPPAATSAGARPALGVVEEPGAPQATFVPPDANGMTFFSITQRLAGGRYRVADVVVREGLGVMHASSGRLAGKQIRRWKGRVESRLGAAPVEVPLEWARHRVAEALKQNVKSGQVLPLGLDGCQALFTPVPAAAPAHPLDELEQALDGAEVRKAADGSGALHNEPELRSWLPDRPALDELLRQVGAKLGPAGGSDQKVVDQVLSEELDGATDRFFTPEVRGALADRMRDAAISVRRRAGDAAARQVLSVARAIREAGIITSPPHEIPFLVSFFRKAIAVLARQGDGRLQVPVPRPAPGEGGLPIPGPDPTAGAELLQGATAEGDAEGDADSDEDDPAATP